MSPFGSKRRHTKKSCLGNALVGLVLAMVIGLCALIRLENTPETRKNLLLAAGLMLVMAGWWVYRYFKFDQKNFDDPFHLDKK